MALDTKNDKLTKKVNKGRGNPNIRSVKAGSRLGKPNKVTADVREAVSLFAQRNASRIDEWLQRVAETKPDRALDIYFGALEYHIPKLSRTEMTGLDGQPLFTRIEIVGVAAGEKSNEPAKD